MTPKKLIKIIEEGEGLYVEFKQRFSTHEKIAKEIIAFANTRGGIIIFGVDDDGSVYGVLSEKSEAELIKQTAEQYCEPQIAYKLHFIEIEDKEVVVAEIAQSPYKPHRLQDYKTELDLNTAQVYMRVNDKSVQASKEMIKILQAGANDSSLKNYQVGKVEKAVFDYLDKNETITVKELAQLANLSSRRSSRTLINLVRANLLLIHTKDNGEDFYTYAG